MNEGRGGPSSLPQAVWNAAARPGEPGYLGYLTELLQVAMALPGAVFVRVPEGKLDDPEWADVVQATSALCACRHRRLLEPLVRQDWDWAGGETVVIEPGKPLEIRPWGGDRESALLRLEVERQGGLHSQRLPYYGLQDDAAEGMAFASAPASARSGTWQQLSELAAAVNGSVPAVVAQLYRSPYTIITPLCALAAVDVDGLKVHVQVHPAVMYTDPTVPCESHICVA